MLILFLYQLWKLASTWMILSLQFLIFISLRRLTLIIIIISLSCMNIFSLCATSGLLIFIILFKIISQHIQINLIIFDNSPRLHIKYFFTFCNAFIVFLSCSLFRLSDIGVLALRRRTKAYGIKALDISSSFPWCLWQHAPITPAIYSYIWTWSLNIFRKFASFSVVDFILTGNRHACINAVIFSICKFGVVPE